MRPRGACVRSGRRATACAIAFFFAALVAAKAADAAVGGGPDARANDGAGGTLAAAVAAGMDPAAEPRSIADLYRDFSDAIVRVAIVTNNAEGVPVRFTCTGFVISPQGRVVTSFNDNLDVTRVWVEKDGLDYAAEFLGGDVRTHIALIQLNVMPEKMAVIPIDVPNLQLPIGTSVVALSQPLEFDPTPTVGIVTGYESSFAQYVFPCSYMRTSIPNGPGEAGAPVLDMTGTLAGVMVARLPELRSSYLVTPNALQRIVRELSVRNRAHYGALPVEFAEAPDKPYVARQVVVSAVKPGSTAERAGIRPGDVLRRLILETNRDVQLPQSLSALGEGPIRRISHVRDMLFHALPGERMRIEVERDGQPIPAFNLPVEELSQPDVMETETPPPAPAETEPEFRDDAREPPLSR